MKLLIRLLVILYILNIVNCSDDDDDLTVSTTTGKIKGKDTELTTVWLGIPYAEPPVNSLRFQPPQPIKSWNNILDTTKYGHVCPQLHLIGKVMLGNEDCLTLNIVRPRNYQIGDEPLPVMIWIHGGGFVEGASNIFNKFDPTSIVSKHNIIHVSMNYRLGALGFLSHNALMKENQYNSTGNYGTMDQQLAMKWTMENIAKFGGDTKRITLYGESAGAISVCWHLVSPYSRSLFSRAIMESGTCDNPGFFQSISNATTFGAVYANAFGCTFDMNDEEFLSCIRNLSVSTLISSISQWKDPNWPNTNGNPPKYLTPNAPIMPFGPAIDGTNVGLPDLPITLMQKGDCAHVPLIIGTNENEGDLFIGDSPIVVHNITYPLNDTGVKVLLRHYLNESAAEDAYKLYPKSEFPTDDARGSRILTDYIFACASRRAARALTNLKQNVYLYLFTYKGDFYNSPPAPTHGDEVEFVFDTPFPPILHTFSQRDNDMAYSFGQFWTNFARTGDPNGEESGIWKQWKPNNMTNIIMNVPLGSSVNYRDLECGFWDSVLA